jgi:NADPH2:quinone reductase
MPGEARDARVGCAYVDIGLSFDRARILGFQLTNLQIHGYDARPDLRELADRVAVGGYRVPIETVVPLEEARAAHERLERRDNRGKIVLSAGPEFGK